MKSTASGSSEKTPAGVWNPEVVDLVTFNHRRDEFVLHMIDDRDWSVPSEQLSEIREKVTSYLEYVLGGRLDRDFPDSQGRSVRFELDCCYPPSDDLAYFIEATAGKLEELGIRFSVSVID